jgi:hypothetical protein
MISDKRRHGRREIMSTIEYFAEPVTAYETLDGVIVNASESGLCILTAHFLNKDQIIEIKSNGIKFLKRQPYVGPANTITSITRWD